MGSSGCMAWTPSRVLLHAHPNPARSVNRVGKVTPLGPAGFGARPPAERAESEHTPHLARSEASQVAAICHSRKTMNRENTGVRAGVFVAAQTCHGTKRLASHGPECLGRTRDLNRYPGAHPDRCSGGHPPGSAA